MRVRVGVLVALVVLVAVGCYVPYDFDGSDRTSIVWWSNTSHQWLQHDPAAPGGTRVLASGGSDSDGRPGDFDGDGRYDAGILRTDFPWIGPVISWDGGFVRAAVPGPAAPSPWTGTCYCTTAFPLFVFGAYDGGHRTLPAYYHVSDATWTISGREPFQFGRGTHAGGLPDWDVPVPGDYDGDGTTDVAVYNPVNGEWTVRQDGQPVVIATHGGEGAFPLPGDWDGDGDTDPAYATRTHVHVLGQPDLVIPADLDMAVPILGDYDGDGRTDLGALRVPTGGGPVSYQWVTTVRGDGVGTPETELAIGQVVGIGDGLPAPLFDTFALSVEISRLTYLQQCLSGAQTC